MNCPRCDAPLREHEPTCKWQRYFECRQCCLTFELVTERHRAPCGHNPEAWYIRHATTLQPGRTARNGLVVERADMACHERLNGNYSGPEKHRSTRQYRG
jgi:hypothetical protein